MGVFWRERMCEWVGVREREEREHGGVRVEWSE